MSAAERAGRAMAPAVALPIPLPPVIGHRGAAAHAPENTLVGLRAAAALGVTMVEVDVKLTADGVPVLMHDERLDRTTDGTGAMRGTPWAAIRRRDAGCWFSPAFAGEPVPSLDEALDLALSLGLAVDLEMKPCRGREAETARKVLDVARSLWPADRPPPLISSFSTRALAEAARAAPDWPRGLLIGRPYRTWRRIARRLGASLVGIDHRYATIRRVEYCRAMGMPLLAYTVNDPIRARTVYDFGIRSVFSDAPDRLAAVEAHANGR